SRATIYRLFPGGREVLFEALRVRELDRFFADLRAEVETADTLDDIVDHLHNRKVDGAVVLDDGMLERIHAYREQYGA
ncbi:MAG: hypothetical protein EBY65_07735, partial [Acidimicrobiia bacterium]|nr:hypothetical protein [Acidimicrobiia bacterium]